MKSTKKRIDEVAQKLRRVFREGCQLRCDSWRSLDTYNKESWRYLAAYVLAEPTLAPVSPGDELARRLAAKRRNRKLGVAGPKSCKLVAGKRVCE
jgi:hypothetical protein